MTHAELQTLVVNALVAAKPVTEATALQIATQTLNDAKAGKQASDFIKWFDLNGAWLVRRINE